MTTTSGSNEYPTIESVQDSLLFSGKKYADKIVFEDLNETPLGKLTYAELLENVLKFGSALQTLELKERTHIAIIGENRTQWALSFLTIMSFNYVAVPIDRNLSENEILNIIHESDSEGVIFSESYKDIFVGGKTALKRLKHYICMDNASSEENVLGMKEMIEKAEPVPVENLPKIDPDEMAEIIFTSGSLGRAKGVMLSQKNIAANLMSMVQYVNILSTDRFLSVLPMHHTYECTCGILCPVYCGSSVHFARSLKTIVDDVQKVKATIMLGVPLLYDKMYKRISKTISEDKVKSKVVPPLVKMTNFAGKLGLKNLKKGIFKELHAKFGGEVRLFIAGGAAPDPLVAEGLRGLGFNFIQGYGLTETAPILALNKIDDFKDDAAGVPLPGVEIKINDPDENGSGEVWAKGPNVMLGYYKNEEQTKETFEGDWFKTGDIGFIDSDGFLHINGRMKNVIISRSGKNVFPEEIEDVINRSPFVLECLVYGEEDEKQDEIIAAQIVVDAEAFIELSESANIQITDELMQKKIAEEIKHVNKQLTSYKQVKKFYIREEQFEKTTTQKIKRFLVKKENQ